MNVLDEIFSHVHLVGSRDMRENAIEFSSTDVALIDIGVFFVHSYKYGLNAKRRA